MSGTTIFITVFSRIGQNIPIFTKLWLLWFQSLISANPASAISCRESIHLSALPFWAESPVLWMELLILESPVLVVVVEESSPLTSREAAPLDDADRFEWVNRLIMTVMLSQPVPSPTVSSARHSSHSCKTALCITITNVCHLFHIDSTYLFTDRFQRNVFVDALFDKVDHLLAG